MQETGGAVVGTVLGKLRRLDGAALDRLRAARADRRAVRRSQLRGTGRHVRRTPRLDDRATCVPRRTARVGRGTVRRSVRTLCRYRDRVALRG